MDTQNRIIKCLEQVGLVIEEKSKTADFELSNYLEDSIVFIQFIVSLEEEFEIEFPDEYLLIDKLSSLSALSATMDSLIV